MDQEVKREKITARITPTSRKKLGTISKQLGLSESEAIRVIIDDSLGSTSAEIKRVSEQIVIQLKQLTFDQHQLQKLRDMTKDVAREYRTLSDSKAYKAGLKKTKEPGFERVKVKS